MEVKHEVTRAVIEKKTICTSIYCDRCNKRIYTTIRPGMIYPDFLRKIGYYEVQIDWHNPSVAQVEHKTICAECISDEFANFKDQTTARSKDNIADIKIWHVSSYDFGEWTDEEENSYD